jgi:hypothetical protein
MIITEMNDPSFVVLQAFEVTTDRGVLLIGESEPCSFVSDPDGNVFIGNGGTVLQVEHNTALTDLQTMISPAKFELVVEEDSEMSLCATLIEPRKVVPSKTEQRFSDVAKIISIRPFDGVQS